MNPVRFYLVRHGQTWSNLRHMMIGGAGSAPLTPTGRLAAKCLGLGLRDVAFAAAYASPLGRTMETASLVLRHNAAPPPLQEEDGVRDVFWGELEAGVPDDVRAMKTRYADDSLFPMGRWDTPEYASVYGGETACDFIRRFQRSLEDIADRHPEGGNILLVSHAALGSFLAKHGAPSTEMDTANISTLPEVANTSVSIVVLEGGEFRVERVNDLSFIHAGEKAAGDRPALRLRLFSDVHTLYEEKGLLLGCADSRLSDRGVLQAERHREQYGAQTFSAVYCSPLGRSRDLCRRVLNQDANRKNVVLDDDLREIELTQWEAERTVVLAERYPVEYEALSTGKALLQYVSPVGGESGMAAALRLDRRLRAIGEEREFSGGEIGVFTHRIALKAWLILNGLNQPVETGSAISVEYRNGTFSPGRQARE